MKTLTENELVQHLQQANLKVTPQRMAIYQAILEIEEHPTAEIVYQKLGPKYPTVTLATIYRTLDSLCEVGLIKNLLTPHHTKRYDKNLEAHHHLICSRCQKIIDLPYHEITVPALPEHITGFVSQEIQIQILGLCNFCQK